MKQTYIRIFTSIEVIHILTSIHVVRIFRVFTNFDVLCVKDFKMSESDKVIIKCCLVILSLFITGICLNLIEFNHNIRVHILFGVL